MGAGDDVPEGLLGWNVCRGMASITPKPPDFIPFHPPAQKGHELVVPLHDCSFGGRIAIPIRRKGGWIVSFYIRQLFERGTHTDLDDEPLVGSRWGVGVGRTEVAPLGVAQ